MKRWTAWIAVVLAVALLAGCADAGAYVKDRYPLVKAEGQGSQVVKVYSAEGKDVPTVAKELAAEERPREMSKESADQMFLVYDDKIINLQKDPKNPANTLVEIDTIAYARDHYDSSFLQGYLTATVLQSLFGGGWFNRAPAYPGYRGYTSVNPNVGGGFSSAPQSGPDTKQPATTQRSGTFSTGKSGSDSVRKYDGSVPKVSNGAGSSFGASKPNTSTRSGSFSRRK
jgi:hypothetical protein